LLYRVKSTGGSDSRTLFIGVKHCPALVHAGHRTDSRTHGPCSKELCASPARLVKSAEFPNIEAALWHSFCTQLLYYNILLMGKNLISYKINKWKIFLYILLTIYIYIYVHA
jgi:hypothetical protein